MLSLGELPEIFCPKTGSASSAAKLFQKTTKPGRLLIPALVVAGQTGRSARFQGGAAAPPCLKLPCATPVRVPPLFCHQSFCHSG